MGWGSSFKKAFKKHTPSVKISVPNVTVKPLPTVITNNLNTLFRFDINSNGGFFDSLGDIGTNLYQGASGSIQNAYSYTGDVISNTGQALTEIDTGIPIIDGALDFVGGFWVGLMGDCEDSIFEPEANLPAVTEDYMRRARALEESLGLEEKFSAIEYGGMIISLTYSMGFAVSADGDVEGLTSYSTAKFQADSKLQRVLKHFDKKASNNSAGKYLHDVYTLKNGVTLRDMSGVDAAIILNKCSSLTTVGADIGKDEAVAIELGLFVLQVLALIYAPNTAAQVAALASILMSQGALDGVSPEVKLAIRLYLIYMSLGASEELTALDYAAAGMQAVSAGIDYDQETWLEDEQKKQQELQAQIEMLEAEAEADSDRSIMYDWIYEDPYEGWYDYSSIYDEPYR